MTETTTTTGLSEREELVAILERQRGFLLTTVRGLTDDQARLTSTVSTLSLGGLVKHITATVASWLDFVERGAPENEGMSWEDADPSVVEAYANGFRLLEDETLAEVVEGYAAVSERAAALVRSVDLDAAHTLPPAPWFTPGEAWNNQRVFMHVLAETAQHSGHADLIREAIDGQKTMG